MNIFKGDYYKNLNKFNKAYIYYLFAMKTMKKIYKNAPNEGMLNDIVILCSKLSEISKRLNRKKDKIKWDETQKKLLIESEKYNEK